MIENKHDISSDDLPNYMSPCEAYIQAMADYHFRQEIDELQQEAMEILDCE